MKYLILFILLTSVSSCITLRTVDYDGTSYYYDEEEIPWKGSARSNR